MVSLESLQRGVEGERTTFSFSSISDRSQEEAPGAGAEGEEVAQNELGTERGESKEKAKKALCWVEGPERRKVGQSFGMPRGLRRAREQGQWDTSGPEALEGLRAPKFSE